MDIGEVLTRHGSDKNTYHTYGPVYQELFAPIREQIQTVLEIGVLGGASLRAWEEFFPNAQIYGLDINVEPYECGRIKVFKCDATKEDEIPEEIRGMSFDVGIDDGSHWESQQIDSWKLFWPKIKLGGIWCVEDIQASQSYAKFEEMGATVYDLRGPNLSFDNALAVWHKK